MAQNSCNCKGLKKIVLIRIPISYILSGSYELIEGGPHLFAFVEGAGT